MEPAKYEGRDIEPAKKLYRRRDDRMVAGVSGGLADYLNIDVTLIRVLFVVLAVMGGAGLIIYLAMWILVPQAPA